MIAGIFLVLLSVPVTVLGEDVEFESVAEEETGTLVVTIEDLRNCDGNVRVELWASEDVFPHRFYRR